MPRVAAAWLLFLYAISGCQAQVGLSGGLGGFGSTFSSLSSLGGTQESPITTIYKDGFADGWKEASWGCSNCTFRDKDSARRTSLMSITAVVDAWGAIVLEASKPFTTSYALTFWMRGSGATSFTLFMDDTAGRRYSREVVLTTGDKLDENTVFVHGSDDDGWVQVQVTLSRMVDASDAKSLLSPATFSRFVFRDRSGTGFSLQLDDIKLISSSKLSAFKAASIANSLILPTFSMPIFGRDQPKRVASRSSYIMRLRPGVSFKSVAAICAELAGSMDGAPRFAGACDNTTSSWLTAGTSGLTSAVDWRFVSFKVASDAALSAMRRVLTDKAEYIEADFKATALPHTHHRLLSFQTDAATTFPEDAAADGMQLNGNNTQDATKVAPVNVKTDEGSLIGTALPISELPANDTELSMAEDYTATIQLSVRSWGLDRLDQLGLPLDGVYSPGDLDGRGVHVFVLDTGLRASHLAFRSRVSDGASFVGGSTNDMHGHGTHVAGTACGSVYGVARSCIIHPVKVLGDDGSASYSNIIAGMRWVKNYKINNNIQSAVVTMSLGGPRAASLNDAVEDLVAAGISVVVAAGNDNRGDACTKSPSSARSAIVVGSSTEQDTMSTFSNIGSCLTVFAPGSYIVSAGVSSDSDERTMSGTSMAAPHVSGIAALYLQARPGASPADVRRAIVAAAIAKTFDPSSAAYLSSALANRLRGQVSPAPAPPPTTTAPAPKPTPASPSPKPSTGLTRPSFCTTCPWCMFCR